MACTHAAAHHANSAYDRNATVQVSGTVTRWQFINPQVGIWIEAADENGEVREWTGEFQSVQDLYRLFGWNKDTFQPGDPVTLIGNPDRRPDHHSMWVEGVIFADGTEVDVQNNTVWILNREDGEVVTRVGSAGDNGGQFHGMHMVSVDSQGNLYTGEVQQGERVQRFRLMN